MSNNDLIFVNNGFGLCALQVGVDPLVRQRVWEHILEVATILNILEMAAKHTTIQVPSGAIHITIKSKTVPSCQGTEAQRR